MHDRAIVVNTTPLIGLSASGYIEVLPLLYERVLVPREVADEIRAGGPQALGVRELSETAKLEVQTEHTEILAYLVNALDRGEASVIATALLKDIRLVCIDETVGRRVARLAGLDLTGSIGILLKAKRQGFPVVMAGNLRPRYMPCLT